MPGLMTHGETAPSSISLKLGTTNGFTTTLKDLVRNAEAEYSSQHGASQKAHVSALESMPGGNTRSVLYNRPFPLCMKMGKGRRVWDLDGHEYLDLVGEMSAGLYGHSNSHIREALMSAFDIYGVNLGAHNLQEQKLAALIRSRFPSIEHVRFCNSGTEANLYALSVARRATGRRKVIVFNGGYHGGVLGFAHGVSANAVDPEDWIVGNYNCDEAQLQSLFEAPDRIAAVLVEAMQGAGGCLPATREFLHSIQSLASAHQAVFILDEVMTSRLHPSGLQGKYGLRPDLTTLGKYIGGGLAFGAFGGREALLKAYDPRESSALPHSGTFNNNTLTMATGFTGLSQIYTPEANLKLNALGDVLRTKLQDVAADTKMVVTGVGAVMTVHFLDNGATPVRAEDIEKYALTDLKRLFWFWCLKKGYWIAERGMISLLLDTTLEEVNSFVQVVKDFISQYRLVLKVENHGYKISESEQEASVLPARL